MKKFLKNSLIAILLLISMLVGCAAPLDDMIELEQSPVIEDYQEEESQDEILEEETQDTSEEEVDQEENLLDKDGEYTSKEEVALYIHLYGELPSNFITKKEAKALGWESKEGNLWEVAPGKSIGGDYFGNYEELLPEEDGRDYYECDIDTDGSYRGAKRIVFSNDGLIYYTEDHYESFELLYGEE